MFEVRKTNGDMDADTFPGYAIKEVKASRGWIFEMGDRQKNWIFILRNLHMDQWGIFEQERGVENGFTD